MLAEVETVHNAASDDERLSRRLSAIGAAEAERARFVSELQESNREGESRRMVARAAASEAAEGERRRRMSVITLQELEELKVRATAPRVLCDCD